ncbi:MAG: hypothetical protein ABIY55_35070 [Kofleriaceae bacterium]
MKRIGGAAGGCALAIAAAIVASSCSSATRAPAGGAQIANGPVEPARPQLTWSADGTRVVIDGGWSIDPADGTWVTVDGARHGASPRVVFPEAPGSRVAGAARAPRGTRVAWGEPGRVCVHDPGEAGYACVIVPSDRRDPAPAEGRVRRALAGAKQLYWIDGEPPACVAWTVGAAGSRIELTRRWTDPRGEHTMRYQVDVVGDQLELLGPGETLRATGTDEAAAVGCVSRHRVRAIADDAIALGGTSWYLSATACERARATASPPFSPRC